MYQTNQDTVAIRHIDSVELDLFDIVIHDGNLFRLIENYGDYWEFESVDWNSKLAEQAKTILRRDQ